jgi:hypothetical protein
VTPVAKKGKGNDKKTPAPPTAVKKGAAADDDTAAQRRVALLRHKLTKAMNDPLMRDQIVKAIRSMMAEEK